MDAQRPDGTTGDAELARAAVAGDRAAFAAIYDRYADRLHDFCHTLLADRDEAADATQDTFLIAAERLGQLRDPERLRPWLYAVARSQASRRLRARRRTVLEAEVSDVPHTGRGPAEGAELGELRELVWSAAGGLASRDRALLDLHVRHGLEGAELGEAMGVGASHAYVLLSRLRDQVERSLGALLVARLGREDCAELAALLSGWDGRFSPLIRKRVARHVDHCDLCAERRRAVASPLSLLAAVPLMSAPAALRDRVLDQFELASASSHGPGDDGPGGGGDPGGPSGEALASVGAAGRPGRRPRSRRSAVMLLGVLALIGAATTGVVLALGGGADPLGAPAITAGAATSTAAAGTETTAGTVGGAGATTVPTTAPPGSPSSTAPGVGGSTSTGPPGASTTAPAPAPPALRITPTALDLGADRDQATLILRNPGGTPLDWSATATAAWLRSSPSQGRLGAGGQTQLAVTADRAALKEGPAAATLRLSSAAGGASVAVRLTVERPPTIGEPTASPPRIQVAGETCKATTSLIQVAVEDESGLAQVVLEWGPGPTRTAMEQQDGAWFANLGPATQPGPVTSRIVATDQRGNIATADGAPVTAFSCPT
jgi:RNA polymerase sigma factor (sigma-70 family)